MLTVQLDAVTAGRSAVRCARPCCWRMCAGLRPRRPGKVGLRQAAEPVGGADVAPKPGELVQAGAEVVEAEGVCRAPDGDVQTQWARCLLQIRS